MEFDPPLVDALTMLQEGLDDPTADLAALMTELVTILIESVDSLVSVAARVVITDAVKPRPRRW